MIVKRAIYQGSQGIFRHSFCMNFTTSTHIFYIKRATFTLAIYDNASQIPT